MYVNNKSACCGPELGSGGSELAQLYNTTSIYLPIFFLQKVLAKFESVVCIHSSQAATVLLSRSIRHIHQLFSKQW